MSDKETGGPAFPHGDASTGMTLRDYFAAKAMQGLLACPYPVSELGYKMKDKRSLMENSAIFAYELADAMIAARAE